MHLMGYHLHIRINMMSPSKSHQLPMDSRIQTSSLKLKQIFNHLSFEVKEDLASYNEVAKYYH